jgi:hypothetical protein
VRRLDLRRSGPWIGMAGLFCALWLYGAAGLVAPAWAVVLLLAVWLVHFVLACRWFTRRPYAVLLLPVAALALWFVALVAGGAFLGWNA